MERKKRKPIVVIINGLLNPIPPIKGGGPQIVIFNTCKELTDTFFDWFVLSNWDASLDAVDYDKDKFIAVKTTIFEKIFVWLIKLLPYRIIKGIFGVTRKDYLTLNIKLVRYLLFSNFDLAIIHESLPLAFLLHRFFPHKKIITYVHNSKIHLDFNENLWQHYVNASTAGMILGSEISLADIRHCFKYQPCKTWIVYNGIDTNLFNSRQKDKYHAKFREKYNLSEQNFVFIYCGRITPIKNINLIISSFLELVDQMGNVRLVIVGSAEQDELGDTDYQNKLHQMIPENHQKKVIFTGFIPQENLPEIYSIADCGILATKAANKETLPLFLLECLACGIPVIASSVGAIPEVIRNGKEGILINENYSQTEMIEAMRQMVLQKKEWISRSKEIENYVLSNFTWKRVASDLISIVQTSL